MSRMGSLKDNMIIRDYPWLTKDAIIFLTNFLNKHKNAKILEFGSGASTIWFSKFTNNLTSVEHNPKWYENVNKNLNHKIDYRLIEKGYYQITNEFSDDYFDIVLIDGQTRMKCLKNSIAKLKPGGILMLDNAERRSYRKAKEILKDWKLFESIQTEPKENESYDGKQTNWWIKPIL